MSSLSLQTRGGWFFDAALLRGTGVAVGTIITLLSHPAEANVGTAGSRVLESRQPYNSITPQLKVVNLHQDHGHRTVAEELKVIRSVFNPTMAELAAIFGVSRQALYNWLAGEDPIQEHSERIREIASAADLFVSQGLKLTGQNIKRKIANGKSLLELIREGESAQNAAHILIKILQRENEQKRKISQRLEGRLPRSLNPVDIGMPAMDEKA